MYFIAQSFDSLSLNFKCVLPCKHSDQALFFFRTSYLDFFQVSLVWPELPAGVKFDPSDLELLQHLQGKSSVQNSNSHALIDDFIPTIEELGGICYTHPKNLPGT